MQQLCCDQFVPCSRLEAAYTLKVESYKTCKCNEDRVNCEDDWLVTSRDEVKQAEELLFSSTYRPSAAIANFCFGNYYTTCVESRQESLQMLL